MASIVLDKVSVDLPIYNLESRSLKNSIMSLTSGGRVVKDARRRVSILALDAISMTINHGDRVALVGHNGAGKTTLLRVLAGAYHPSQGIVRRKGKVAAFFDISAGMDPEATGYENIRLRCLYMGLSLDQIRAQMQDIVSFSDLGEYLAMPVRTYSTGMMLRLAFSVSTTIEPDILLMDEWLSVGDAGFVERAKKRVDEIVTRSNILVLATHDMNLIRTICNRAALLHHGKLVAFGPVEDVLATYQATAAA